MNKPTHKCVICGRMFYWSGEASYKDSNNIRVRQGNTVTCSRECSKQFRNSKYFYYVKKI